MQFLILNASLSVVVVKLQSKVQTSVLGLGVDFLSPLSQQQEQQEEPFCKTTLDGRRILMKDDLQWKTIFDGR